MVFVQSEYSTIKEILNNLPRCISGGVVLVLTHTHSGGVHDTFCVRTLWKCGQRS